MVPCDAEYRLKAGDQVFVSAPRLAPKLRYPTHWALGSWAAEVLMFGSYGAGDLDPKASNKLIGNQCLRPLYCTLGTGSCKP